METEPNWKFNFQKLSFKPLETCGGKEKFNIQITRKLKRLAEMKISSCKKIDLGKFYALYFNILNKVIIVYHIVNYTGLPTNDETSETTLKNSNCQFTYT